MVENADLGQALDWDDGVVTDNGGGFELLEPGYYPFRVEKLERERFEGSAKMASCPRAKLTFKLTVGDHEVTVIDRIMLNTKIQWRLSRFFECLDFPKDENGNMHMHWNELDGKSGWLKVKTREYTNKNGETRQSNEVEDYCRPSEAEKAYAEWSARYQQPTQPAQPVQQAPVQPVQTAMPMPAQPKQYVNPTTGGAWSL